MKAIEAIQSIKKARSVYVSIKIRHDDIAVIKTTKAEALKIVTGYGDTMELNVTTTDEGRIVILG